MIWGLKRIEVQFNWKDSQNSWKSSEISKFLSIFQIAPPDVFFNLSILQTFFSKALAEYILTMTTDLTADFLSAVMGNIHLATGAF